MPDAVGKLGVRVDEAVLTKNLSPVLLLSLVVLVLPDEMFRGGDHVSEPMSRT